MGAKGFEPIKPNTATVLQTVSFNHLHKLPDSYRLITPVTTLLLNVAENNINERIIKIND